jgi:hypothetical protein
MKHALEFRDGNVFQSNAEESQLRGECQWASLPTHCMAGEGTLTPIRKSLPKSAAVSCANSTP